MTLFYRVECTGNSAFSVKFLLVLLKLQRTTNFDRQMICILKFCPILSYDDGIWLQKETFHCLPCFHCLPTVSYYSLAIEQ